jgi:hypothetical protein
VAVLAGLRRLRLPLEDRRHRWPDLQRESHQPALRGADGRRRGGEEGEVTVTVETTMELIVCARCSMAFAVPARFEQARRRDHREFWCPSGHGNLFHGPSVEEKLRKQVSDLEARLTHARDERDWERGRRESTERSLSATKGVLTRTKRRVAAGVCPCCKRTFAQLARHMAGQHPEYVEETAGGAG